MVGYLHEWTLPEGETPSGEFFYYPKNDNVVRSIPPTPLSGSAVDGAKMIHSAGVYKPNMLPPTLSKDKHNKLVYAGDEKWELREDNKTVRQYDTNDLRMTLVYRSRCFEDEEAMLSFNKRNPTAATIKPAQEDIDTS